jgi:hypothetical protein
MASNLSGPIISDNFDQVKNKQTVTDDWLWSKNNTKPISSHPSLLINLMKVLLPMIILIGFGMTVNVLRRGA